MECFVGGTGLKDFFRGSRQSRTRRVQGARANVKRMPKTGSRTVQLEITADGRRVDSRTGQRAQNNARRELSIAAVERAIAMNRRRCRTNVDRLLLERR